METREFGQSFVGEHGTIHDMVMIHKTDQTWHLLVRGCDVGYATMVLDPAGYLVHWSAEFLNCDTDILHAPDLPTLYEKVMATVVGLLYDPKPYADAMRDGIHPINEVQFEIDQRKVELSEVYQERDAAERLIQRYRDFVEEHGLIGPEGDLEGPDE